MKKLSLKLPDALNDLLKSSPIFLTKEVVKELILWAGADEDYEITHLDEPFATFVKGFINRPRLIRNRRKSCKEAFTPEEVMDFLKQGIESFFEEHHLKVDFPNLAENYYIDGFIGSTILLIKKERFE